MKKFLVMSFATLAMSVVGSATVVSCVINQDITGSEAGAVVVCGGVTAGTVAGSGAGSFISAITLQVKGTFNDASFTYSGSTNFAFTEQSAQLAIATISGNAPTAGTGDTGSTGVLSASQGGLNLASLAGFNVNVIETLLAGGRFPTNSTVTVQYDYTVTTPTSGVPEPSTYAMIGLGLSALAFARRRA